MVSTWYPDFLASGALLPFFLDGAASPLLIVTCQRQRYWPPRWLPADQAGNVHKNTLCHVLVCETRSTTVRPRRPGCPQPRGVMKRWCLRRRKSPHRYLITPPRAKEGQLGCSRNPSFSRHAFHIQAGEHPTVSGACISEGKCEGNLVHFRIQFANEAVTALSSRADAMSAEQHPPPFPHDPERAQQGGVSVRLCRDWPG